MNSHNFFEKNKINLLNYNLKSKILEYLNLEQIFIHVTKLNKSFLSAIEKNELVDIYKKFIQSQELQNELNFSPEKIKSFKNKINKNKDHEITNNPHLDEICIFCLNFKYKHLKKLFLKKIDIDCKFLGSFVINNKNLRILNLSHNNLGKSNLKILLETLHKNTTLKELCMNDNLIGDNEKDLFFISELLKSNKSIENLIMGKNFIGKNKTDLKYLKEGMENNNKIKTLYLEYNLIGQNEEDIEYLKSLLDSNISLKEFYLFGNKFTFQKGEILRNMYPLKTLFF